MNPFDVIEQTPEHQMQMGGFFKKLKKKLKFNKVNKKLALWKLKLDKKVDQNSPLGKVLGPLRNKLEESKVGKVVLPAVAVYYGGAMASAGAKIGLTEQSKIRAEWAAEKKERAFLRTEDGKEFLANKKKFSEAIKEMIATPEYKKVYEDLKKKGYTDDQIAISWMNSKPVKKLAVVATADTIYPSVEKTVRDLKLPLTDEEKKLAALTSALQMAEKVIQQQAPVQTAKAKEDLTPQATQGDGAKLLPLGIAALMMMAGG